MKTDKQRIVSARKNLLLQKSAQAHRVDHRCAFLSLTQWGPASFTQIDQVRVHNLLVIGQCYTWNLGVG
jgi:hypothetical protein